MTDIGYANMKVYALYGVIYSFERAGWYVVTRSNSIDFHAGPFETKDQAIEEAERFARNALNAVGNEQSNRIEIK